MIESPKKGREPGSGLRGSRTTGVFRAVNFELFAKPVSVPLERHTRDSVFSFLNFLEQSKSVMAIGVVCISLSAGYLYYLNIQRGSFSQNDSTKYGRQTRTKWD